MVEQFSPGRLLEFLERMLQAPAGDLKSTMMQASDLIAKALGADKVDIFLYDSTRESLNAICSSSQPLSALQPTSPARKPNPDRRSTIARSRAPIAVLGLQAARRRSTSAAGK